MYTIDKNIIGAPKIWNNLWCSIKVNFSILQLHWLYLSINLAIHLCIHLSIYIYPSIYPSFCLSIIEPRAVYLLNLFFSQISINPSIYLSIYLTIYLSIYLLIYLSIIEPTTREPDGVIRRDEIKEQQTQRQNWRQKEWIQMWM